MFIDATSINFLISSSNDYKIVDSRPISDQFHEIERIYSNLKHHKIKMDEVFSVKQYRQTNTVISGVFLKKKNIIKIK